MTTAKNEVFFLGGGYKMKIVIYWWMIRNWWGESKVFTAS